WLAVVVTLTWPLAAHLSTRLADTQPACRFDALLTAWAGAWESEALVGEPSQLFDADVYHPARRSLLFVEAGLGALPVFAPVYLATRNPALALNATLLLGVAFTATAIHLVVGGWTGSFTGGLIAAWLFVATPWTLWAFGPTAPNYVVLWWLPYILLLAARGPRSGRGRLALGALIVLQSLVSVIYLAAATFLPLSALALVRLARRATRASGVRLAMTLAGAVVVLSPLYLALLEIRRTQPDLDRQTMWSVTQPTNLPLGPFTQALSPMAAPPVAWGLVALGALVHAVRGRRGRLREPWRHGALWLVVGLVGSIAREVEWGGRRFPGPLGLIGHVVPQVMALRVASRIGVAGAMGSALLAGAGFAEIEGLLRRRSRTGRAPGRIALLAGALVLAT
ncbi:MAG: hypothetical protein ACKOCT_05330, partial [Alphaproteobacteria bacterium]